MGYPDTGLAQLAHVMGVPAIRLRLAIPEEMLPGSVETGKTAYRDVVSLLPGLSRACLKT